ncbi:MAG TPA: saccharopine dehydrogenase NADP-binding domain-containing protein [Vicinamibacteria bacterium]|nr:saccharopine dehydrogenase NADP-binding domain-containing protein [Vicinamibacteria bacterium]
MGTSSDRFVAVLGGAGAMGRAAVYDLSRAGVRVLLLDADPGAARRVARRYGSGRTEVDAADARDSRGLAERIRGAAALVNCGPYVFNLAAMQAALEARAHYVDLGGLFHTTRKQLRLDARFRKAGLLAVLGMGSAPGILNVMARAASDPLRRVESIRFYNGGADFTRYAAPLAFGFAPATVLDEFTLRPMVFEKGRFASKPPLSGGEDFLFEVGHQRTHLSLHSEVATVPLSYRTKGIRECSFKIAYDPALIDRLRLLIDVGLADRRPGPRGVAPRDVLLDCFRGMPPPPAFVDDRDCLAVVVKGQDRNGPVVVRYDMTARPQRRPPLSAVARDTGFPPAIVARMLLEGRIRERGVLPPERCVPTGRFFADLAERGGLAIRVSTTRALR